MYLNVFICIAGAGGHTSRDRTHHQIHPHAPGEGKSRSWIIFLNYFWTILLNFTPSKVSSSCLGCSLSSTRGSHNSHVTSPAGQETGDRGEYLLGGGNSFIVSLMNKEYLKFWKVKEYIQNNFRIENVWVVSTFHFDSVRGSWYLTF